MIPAATTAVAAITAIPAGTTAAAATTAIPAAAIIPAAAGNHLFPFAKSTFFVPDPFGDILLQ